MLAFGISTGTGTGKLSRLYNYHKKIKIMYNQKVAAAGDDPLAEPTSPLPLLFKSVIF